MGLHMEIKENETDPNDDPRDEKIFWETNFKTPNWHYPLGNCPDKMVNLALEK